MLIKKLHNILYTHQSRLITYRFLVDVYRKQKFNMTDVPVIFHSFDSINRFLNRPEYNQLGAVDRLWQVYFQINGEKENPLKHRGEGEHRKRYPLIVIEGLDGTGKSTITSRLADKLNAELRFTPPLCLQEIRELFEDNKPLRTAYYGLGNYIANEEIKKVLQEKPVVLDRFWHSTAAYSLAQAVQNDPENNILPPAGDKIYCWPVDLLKPDIVLLLQVSEGERQRRHTHRNTTNTTQERLLKENDQFRQNVLNAYQNMYNPGVEILNGDPSVEVVVEDALQKIKHLF